MAGQTEQTTQQSGSEEKTGYGTTEKEETLTDQRGEYDKIDELIDKLQVGVAILEWRHNHAFVVSENQSLQEMLDVDLPKKTMITIPMLESVIHSEDMADVLSFWSRVVNQSAAQEGTFRCSNRLTGEMYWLLVQANSIAIRDGAKQILLCCTDVSRQKRMEERLLESQKNLDTAVVHSGIHYWNYDIVSDCIYMNEQTSEEYQMENTKLENYPESWFEKGMVYPEDIPVYRKSVNKVKSGRRYVSFQARILNLRTNRYEWKQIKFTTFYDAENKPSYAITTEEDAVAYKKLEEKLTLIMRQNGIYSCEINLQERTLERQEGNEAANVFGMFSNKLEKLPESLFAHRIILEEDWLRCRRMFDALYEGQEQVKGQMRIWSPQRKEYIWFEFHFTIIEKDKDIPLRAICTSKDISEQKRKEQLYQEEQRVLTEEDNTLLVTERVNLSRKKVESMEIDGIQIDPQIIDGIQDYRERMLYYFDEVLLSDEDNEELSTENLYRLYKNGVQSCEKHYIAKVKNSGSYLCNRVTCRILERPENRDVIAFFYNRDHTIDYINQLAMNTILQNDYEMAGIIFTHTRHIHIITGKAHPERMSEYDQEYDKMIRGLCRRLDKEEGETLFRKIRFGQVQEMLKKKSTYVVDFVQESHGERRRKQLRFTLSHDELPCILMTQSDIHDVVEKEMEKQKQLEDALNLAERASGAKSEFLSTVSHEIRTPMNVIIGMTELAKEEQNDHAAVMDYIEEIEISSRHLLNLVNNVLDMAKIESGEFSLHPQPYAYNELKKNITTLITPLCQQKNIQFIQEDYGSWQSMYVDVVRLNQVLFNLLSNAVKYTQEGGEVRFIQQSKILDTGTQMEAVFIVRDNGIGMSREFQEQMFQPFTQEENRVVASTQGTGLGLSIAKGIVDKMGGNLTVESELGKGTCFTVTLRVPLVDAKEDQEKENKGAEEYDFSGKKILVVEDHSMNQMIIAKLLKNRNAEVVIAADGKQGVNVFAQNAPGTFDLILMDVRMPVMDGLEAAKTIRGMQREDAKSIPILAMTANAYDEDREKSSAAGMNGHLVKPIDVRVLYRQLEQVFREENR